MLRGKSWKFPDNISTDHIAPGRLFHLRSNLEEFAKHTLEDADPNFASNVTRLFIPPSIEARIFPPILSVSPERRASRSAITESKRDEPELG